MPCCTKNACVSACISGSCSDQQKAVCVECMAETISLMLLILVHMPTPLVANSTWHK